MLALLVKDGPELMFVVLTSNYNQDVNVFFSILILFFNDPCFTSATIHFNVL